MTRGTFQVERVADGGRTLFRIGGVIDEHADVSFLRELHGEVAIDLRELQRINSFGVRTWMTAINSVPMDASVELVDCPPAFVDQINMLSGFIGTARVRSFLATYLCEVCEHEADVSIDADECRRNGCSLKDSIPCRECGGTAELNHIESMYLRFLR